MTVINMLRGGPTNGAGGSTFSQNMYPRPDYKAKDMGKNDGWENRPDSMHYVEKFNFCECWTSGAIKRAKDADAGTTACILEVGDEIPLVGLPNRSTLEGVTLDVVNGLDGVTLGVRRYTVAADGGIVSSAVVVDDPLAGIDGAPLPKPVIDQAFIDALPCDGKVDLEDFCGTCDNTGCFHQMWFAAPELVGGCDYEYQYLSLVIEALPADFQCDSCCVEVHVGARVRVKHMGK